MERRQIARNSKGFTLMEVLAAVGLLGLAVFIWLGGIEPMIKLMSRGKDKFDLSVEQRAIVSLFEAVSKSSVRGALCYDPAAAKPDGYPHPYGRVSYDGTCEIIRPWTASERSSWEALADEVMAWQGASAGTTLDVTHFNTKVLPAMSAAGCIKCHGADIPKTYAHDSGAFPVFNTSDYFLSSTYMNTNRPDIANRNFNNINHLIDPIIVSGETYNPLANRAILASPLGEMFFRTQFEISRLIPGSSLNIKHELGFKVEKTSLTIPSFQGIAKTGNFCSPATGGSSSACNATTAATACNAAMGETYDGGSCNCHCIAWNPPPVCSCGKGCVMTCPSYTPTCAQWQAKFNCLSPAKVETNTLFDENGHLPTVANYITPQWETVADNYCTTTLNLCNGTVCSAVGPPAAECLEPNSCRRMCTDRAWSPPVSCGKGCVTPPQPIDCLKQKVEYSCRFPLPQGKTETAILSYTLNSKLLDASNNLLSTIVTSGAIK